MVIRRSITIGEKNTGAKQEISQKQTEESKKRNHIVKKSPETIKRSLEAGRSEVKKKTRVFADKGKVLVVVESPAKAKTIEKFLGDNYVVKASMGHLRDLPKSQIGVDIAEGFVPRYMNISSRKAVIDDLRSTADKSSAVFLATDPDREGEAISWHLATILNLDSTDHCRITFNEITNSAVKEAISHPRAIDMDLVDAQQARRILDRLVGYKLSPLLWKKIYKGLSAGRVQSVAVRLICEREREIEAFEPQEYWSVKGAYKAKDKQEFDAEVTHHRGKKIQITSEEEAKIIKEALLGQSAIVEKQAKRTRTRKAAPPFTTSTLQQEAGRKLNFGAKKTMMIAQHLYEGLNIGNYGHVGLITYMRTDSTRIAKDMQESVKEYIIDTYGEIYYPEKPNTFGVKQNSQDAHEAIRPTMMELSPSVIAPFVSREELRLYTLIWNRFVASQMAAQKTESVTLLLSSKDYTLKAVGSKVLFPGFTEVYDETQREDDYKIPLLAEGEEVINIECKGEQHFTQPPARYTEASLIKTMEEKGIGRPSTYAPTLDTIQSRNYVEKKERQFVPTELGFIVVDFLVAHFPQLINESFTAELESSLDKIAEGEDSYENVMEAFYSVFSEELNKANEVEKVRIEDEESEEVCEKCGHTMVYKHGKFGRFLACSNFPSCKNTKPVVVGTGVICPSCKLGEIIERKSRRGKVFYGCSTYPDCNFTAWDKPIEEACTVCGSIMLEKVYKSGQVKKYCSNETCSTREKKARKTKKAEDKKEN